MAMVPHERSLVERLNNKPFALIGIDFDNTREECKAAEKEKEITWRSFFDGGSTQGPIASKWNVTGWPTVYLIDHKGIIVGRVGMSSPLRRLSAASNKLKLLRCHPLPFGYLPDIISHGVMKAFR